MSERKGTISVKTQDVFPIIKKWLYSEHDIFVRELVANASDAITKRATLGRTQNVETPDGKITVRVNKEAKTVEIEDNGIGMTEQEVEKYIAQLAFSGAEEFVKKMQDEGASTKDDIIGKFGLGFYSAFMVADRVEVETLSMNQGAKPVKWTCEGETDYTFSDSDKTEVGTTITLHINEESIDFINGWKVRETLKNHCDFMPYPIFLDDIEQGNRIGQEIAENSTKPKEEQKEIAPYTPDQINNTTPLWKRDPKELKDEDYKNFYQQLFPMDQEPLFWIHLNVDHPFTLQGILYFPKFNPNKPMTERNIRLYCKQVFVSDDVKNIMPEYLNLLKGTIDSVDIPLNVSRSSLQGDPNIKRISNYITKKVGEALKKLAKTDRPRFEAIWEDIHIFVKYGIISDDKFAELMTPFAVFKNSEGKFVTLEEYKQSYPEALKEKLHGKVIYFNKAKSDVALKKQLLEEGVHTIETEDYIDPHFMQHLETRNLPNEEQNNPGLRFVSIDSEFENLLSAENVSDSDLKIKDIFKDILTGPEPTEEEKKADPFAAMGRMDVEVKSLKNAQYPAYFKVDEQMKRMQQMTVSMGGENKFPVKKTLVINPNNPLIKNALKIWEKGNKDLVDKLAHHVQDLATISSEGLGQEEKDSFVSRTQNLLEELTQFAIN